MGRSVLVAVAFLGLSGCTNGALGPSIVETAPPLWGPVPSLPLAFNSTATPGELVFISEPFESCRTTDVEEHHSLLMYDRHGLLWEDARPFDPDAGRVEHVLEFHGDAPFVFAGIDAPCAKLGKVQGPLDGFLPNKGVEVDMNDLKTYVPVTVSIPVGGSVGTLEWTPSPFTFHFQAILDDPANRTGSMYGTFTLQDSAGNVTLRDVRSLAGNSVFLPTLQKTPGNYTAELILDVPAVTETSWSYFMVVMEFNDSMCFFGLEWPICGT